MKRLISAFLCIAFAFTILPTNALSDMYRASHAGEAYLSSASGPLLEGEAPVEPSGEPDTVFAESVNEPDAQPEETPSEPEPEPAPEDPPVDEPTEAPVEETLEEPSGEPQEEPSGEPLDEPADKPCAITDGCALPEGHAGACEPADAEPEEAIFVTSVTVSGAGGKTVLLPGETLQLTATVLPKNATDPSVAWTSSDETVATVDETGLVTGVSAGKFTVTAAALDGSEETGACTLQVSPAPADGGETIDSRILLLREGDFPSMAQAIPAAFSGAAAQLRAGLADRAEQIDLRDFSLAPEEFHAIYQTLVNEDLSLSYVGGLYTLTLLDGAVQSVAPTYSQSASETESETLRVQAAIRAILADCITDGMTDMQKALAVNDYFCCHYEYAYDSGRGHNYAFLLLEGRGVCQAFSDAYSRVMQALGFNCYTVNSNAMQHSWNMIQLDGQWYHVDVTWNDRYNANDDVVLGFARHKYFLVSDDLMFSTEYGHYAIDNAPAPAASTAYDHAFWQDVDAPVCIVGEDYYYPAEQSDGIWHIMRCSGLSASNAATVKAVDCNRPDGSASVCMGLVARHGRLYYNTATQIRSCLPDGSDDRLEAAPTLQAGSAISRMYTSGDTLYYGVERDLYWPDSVGSLQIAAQRPLTGVLLPETLGVVIGTNGRMVVAVEPANASTKQLAWASDAPDVLTIDETTGAYQALTVGTATVTATASDGSGLSDSCTVVVLQSAITAITVTAAQNAEQVAVGNTLQLSAVLTPTDADNPAVTWSVLDGGTGSATIDQTGLLTATATGSVTVRATSAANAAIYGEKTLTVALSGKYVLVLNTNPDPTTRQSTGTLVFSGAGNATGQPQGSSGYESGYTWISGSSDPGGYTVGESKTIGGTDYICIGVGEHCYVWMEQNLKADYTAADKLSTAAAEMMAVYGGRPYRALTTLAGGEIPAKDNTGKLSILMEELSSSTGYFAGESGITAIHVRTPAAADYEYGDLDALGGLLAHEGQHALFQYLVCGSDAIAEYPLRWLNEGLSVAAMDWVWGGDGNAERGWLSTITGNDDVRCGSSLAYSSYRGDSGLDYGLPYLFVRYLTDQAAHKYDPMTFARKFYLHTISNTDTTGYLNAVLADLGLLDADGNPLTFAKALENFYIAAVVQAGSGVYGFYGDPVVSMRVTYPLFNGVSGQAYTLPGTGAIVLLAQNNEFCIPENAGADVVFVAFNEDSSPSQWGGGLGTEDDPYEIDQDSILGAIALNPSGHYRLTEDIDVSDSTSFTIDAFSGTLDGGGYTITGLNAPLIYQNSGTIRNLNVVLDIDGQYGGYVGGVVGYNVMGAIENVSVTGTFGGRLTGTNPYGSPKVGALCGVNYGTISQCKADVDMSFTLPANHVYIGQIAGENQYQIYNCIAAGSISATQGTAGAYELYAGGLAGRLYDYMTAASIKWSYSITRLSVQGVGSGNVCKVGRLVGYEARHARNNYVESCYGTTGIPAAGGTETSLIALSDSDCLRTDAQLRDQTTFENWDFDTVWELPTIGYPVFIGTVPSAPPVPSVPKTSYYIGEAFDLTGATLVVGDSSVALTTNMLFALPDLTVAGPHTVYGSYHAEPFSFEVTVAAPGPADVTALTLGTPGRSDYYAGQFFDATGVTLLATIGGNSVTLTAGYTLSKTTALSVSDTQITFSYYGKSVSQDITVAPRAILSIERTGDLQKSVYNRGEALSLAGLTLKLTYSDGVEIAGVLPANFARYGLKLVRLRSRSFEEIAPDRTLYPAEDDNAELYVYCGDDVSRFLSEGLRCYVATLRLNRVAYLPDQRITLHIGIDEYAYSESIIDGSGDYSTTLVSGRLPAGVTAQLPGYFYSENFAFYGTAQSAAAVTLVYRVTDNVQRRTFNVNIYLSVLPPSDACDVLSATLGGVPCVVGTDTLTVVVPSGGSLTNMEFFATLSPGATQDKYNGHRFDCSNPQTNPQTLTVTSQSGDFQKVYTLHASVATGGALLAPANLARTGSVVTWDAVTDATGYFVTFYRDMGGELGDEILSTHTTAQTRFDLLDVITQTGSYHISVRAMDDTGAHAFSAAVSCPTYYHVVNLTPVSKITLAGPASILRTQSGAFTAAVTPADAAAGTVSWSIVPLDGEATVTDAGVVTGTKAGKVKVRASAQDASGVYGELSVTIRQLYATSVSIRTGEQPDDIAGQTFHIDLHDAETNAPVQRTMQLAAVTQPVDALNDVSWKSSNAAVASVDATGLVLCKGVGTATITATAADGSGKSAFIKVTCYYVDAATRFTATSGDTPIPAIGLQKGYATKLIVFGTDRTSALDPALFTYTVPATQSAIASVTAAGVVTAGEKPGTATVTAALIGDPLNRKVTLKVPVIPLQTARVLLTPNLPDTVPYTLQMFTVNGEPTDNREAAARYAVLLNKSDLGTDNRVPYVFTLTPSASALQSTGAPGGDPTLTPVALENPALAYSTSDRNLANVAVARDGTVTVTLKRNAAAKGACTITGTSKDRAKAEGFLSVYVRDYAPRLGASALTLNPKLDAGVQTALLASYGNAINTAPDSIRLYEYAGRVLSDTPSTRFNLAFENDLLTLTPTAPIGNATVKAELAVDCADGVTYRLPLTVAVKNSEPGVTVKQSGRFNLFYTDSAVTLTVTAKDQVIENIAFEATDPSVTTFTAAYRGDGQSATVRFAEDPAFTARGAAYTRVNVLIKLAGYTEPVRKVFTLATATIKPSLALSPASSTLNPTLSDRSVTMTVYDKANKRTLPLDADSLSCPATQTFVTLDADYDADTLTLALAGTTGGRATVYVQNATWRDKITLTHTVAVQTALPAAKLGTGTLKLNRLFSKATASTTLTLNQANRAIGRVEAVATGNAAARAEATKLTLRYEDGVITAGILNEADPPKAGTYSFTLTPFITGEEEMPLKALTLRILIAATAPKVSLTVPTLKLNSAFAGTETAVSAFQLSPGYRIVNATIAPAANNPLQSGAIDFTFNPTDPQNPFVTAVLNPAATAPNKTYNYLLTPTVEDPALNQTVQLAPISLRVQVYRKLAASATVSASGKLDAIRPDSAVLYTVTRLNNVSGTITDVALVGADAALFDVALNHARNSRGQQFVTLTMRNGEVYATNRTYKIQLVFTVDGVIADVKTGVLSLRVSQSALKLAATPKSAVAFQSQSGSVSVRYRLTMTSPGGAKLDSIALNPATALAFRRALGVNGTIVPTVSGDGRSATVDVLLKDTSKVKFGTTYTVLLDVTPVGNAANVKPTTVKVSMKINP